MPNYEKFAGQSGRVVKLFNMERRKRSKGPGATVAFHRGEGPSFTDHSSH